MVQEAIECISLVTTKAPNLKLLILIKKEEVQKALQDRKQLFLVQETRGGKLGYFRIRANGALKQWKTQPERWSLPCKYGLKNCFRVTDTSNVSWIGMLAIEAGEKK